MLVRCLLITIGCNIGVKTLQFGTLLIGHRKRKCANQIFCIHNAGALHCISKKAEYVKLEQACFRRTSVTLWPNTRWDILKRHSEFAEKYVDESIENKARISRMIEGNETYERAAARIYQCC